ncbi:MAG: ATP-binding cassette domain-containing protein, partial [Acidimicrobiales bacterium]|nr:ATP-binding cassette domain-containing protein [Acidimicrobiales bacterium]
DGDETVRFGDRTINARAYLKRFQFPEHRANEPIDQLSGGERARLLLAKVLKSGANVLLLDEPTNDLDVDTLRALEGGLEDFAGCAVVISHDRWFLDRIATHVLAFEGNSAVRWFEGNFSEYEAFLRKEFGSNNQPTRIKYKAISR